jgi:Flp pilus assembly protein TadG
MTRTPNAQRGQVMIVFALLATVLVGIIALAIDYGLLVDHRRNLQAFADAAVEAGAQKLSIAPTPSDRKDARTAAFVYLRDNLQLGNVTTTNATCGTSPVVIDLSTDITNCVLGSGGTPGSYTISIRTPAQPPVVSLPEQSWTVSVSVAEAVTTTVAKLLSVSGPLQAGASATAYFNHRPRFPWAVYTSGCLSTGTHLEIFGGNAGINAVPGGGCAPTGTFCAESSPGGSGSIVFGTAVQDPLNLLPGSTVAVCTAGAANQVLATGSILHSTIAPAAGFAVPPQILASSSFPVPQPCFFGSNCASAVNNASCLNGENGSNCFSPGSYGDVGPVSNNLNPGVYYVNGKIWFTGNTINANWQDIYHRCWKLPNAPAAWTFSSQGCTSTDFPANPDGFTFDPTTPSDPQCTSYPGLASPTITALPLATGGNLDPAGPPTGTTYYVGVTALDAIGETTITEKQVIVIGAAANQGAIQVTVVPEPGATSYQVYGPSTVSGHEWRYPDNYSSSGIIPGGGPYTITLTNLPVGYPTAASSVSPPAGVTASGSVLPGTGTLADGTYYVRITTLKGGAESAASGDIAATVTSSSGKGAITVSIPLVPGATGYNVYGPATVAGREFPYLATIPQPGPPATTATATVDHVPTDTNIPSANTTSNAPLGTPSFTLVAGAAGGPGLATGTYYARVTAVNASGETLSNEVSQAVVGPAGSITANITPLNGASSYRVYGPSTTPNTEVLNATVAAGPTPSALLTSVPASGAPYPRMVDTTGCGPAGFHNIPNNQSQNYGVTIVLGQNASFCLNDNCNGSGSSPPEVLLSPACYNGFIYKGSTDRWYCNATDTGPLQSDGASVIFSYGTGTIEAQGSGGPWAMSGTLYAPYAQLTIGPGSGVLAPQVELVPGQLIIGNASMQTGNGKNPAVWWNNDTGNRLAQTVKLIR